MNIMPRLDLTDRVSIIFSLSFLQARTEAAGPDEEKGRGGLVAGEGGANLGLGVHSWS